MDELCGLWLSDFHARTLCHLDTALKAVDDGDTLPRNHHSLEGASFTLHSTSAVSLLRSCLLGQASLCCICTFTTDCNCGK